MNRAFIAIGALLFLALCCCGPYSPLASMLTIEKPDSADVIGLYQMTGQNLNRSEPFQDRHPEILINEDGSCQVTDFPVWITNDEITYSVKEWLSFKGTWGMSEIGSVQRGNGSYKNWGIGCGKNEEKLNVTGELANSKPPYDILFIYDDPDSGNGMTFGKVP
jgi:hypothetical protein